jgi:hypothetical protein
MSKLSFGLPGEAPARPIMVAGSNCGWEFMGCGGEDDEGEVEVDVEFRVCSLGGSTCLLSFDKASFSSCSFFFFSFFFGAWFRGRASFPGFCDSSGVELRPRIEGTGGAGGMKARKGRCYFEKISLPRRTRRDTRRREGEIGEGGGEERNRSLMAPSPRDWGLLIDIY